MPNGCLANLAMTEMKRMLSKLLVYGSAGTRASLKMARLAEDTDDELPELIVVTGKKTPARKSAQNRTSARSTTEPRIAGLQHSLEDFKGTTMDIEKRKPRRRALKKIYDNPLLRPFDQLNESTSLLTSSKRSESHSTTLRTMPTAQTESKAHSNSSTSSKSEREENSPEDSMSDFIVNDDSLSLEESSTDGDCQIRPPKFTRRLIRGRRSPGPDSPQEGQPIPFNDSQSQQSRNRSPSNCQAFSGLGKWEEALQISSNAFPGVKLGGRSIVTPPSSPQKTQKSLLSPKKGPRIPMTPHRPSMDAFWDPDVINEWNEEYSPRKTPKHQYRTGGGGLEMVLPTSTSKKNQQMWKPNTHEAKKSFSSEKDGIAVTFLRELDEKITEGKLSEMAALTGGIKIIWSKKLNTTAGRANWKRETIRSTVIGVGGKSEAIITYRHYASIELAEKVIDDEERLLNVIAHEFCHLANFMVTGVRNNPHGKEFKAWAVKCSQQFFVRGIHVTTKHSYDINYKYIWECTNCATEFKRHSKSIDPLKQQCGSCKSKLVQIKPVPRPNVVASEYQLFLKDNMRKVKEQNPESPQKQIMTTLGKMYQEHKASKLKNVEETAISVHVRTLREESPADNQVDLVTRKLNILELTNL